MKETKHTPVPWGDDLEAWLEVRNAEQIESDIRAYAAQAVAAEREACAVAAWSTGMGLHMKAHDAREIGSACAKAIRARE